MYCKQQRLAALNGKYQAFNCVVIIKLKQICVDCWCDNAISDAKNDYNLNLPRYIDSTEAEDLQDIEGHLRGGIPNRDLDALHAYWQVIPSVRSALFEDLRTGYSQLRIAKSEIKPTIFGHPEFTAFNAKATALFDQWKSANTPHLKGLDKDGLPKVLIETIAKQVQAGTATATPPALNTPGKRALFNNLGGNEALALKIDETVRTVKPNAFRGHQARENVIKAALLPLLGNDKAEVERIFKIIVAQTEY